jgi:hypothetical protein
MLVELMPLIHIVFIAVVIIALSGLRVAQEYERGVIFRLGRYNGLRGPGLYWIIPLNIERSVRVDIRTRTVSAEQQETITRDSVTIKVNAVLWYRIVDAEKSVIAVADAPAAVYQLALTGLRNIIGQHDLDEVLQERNKIKGDPRKAGAHHQGRSRVGGVGEIVGRRGANHFESGRIGIAPDANDCGGRSGKQQHHGADDSLRLRLVGAQLE